MNLLEKLERVTDGLIKGEDFNMREGTRMTTSEFYKETLEILTRRKIEEEITKEVERLLTSGAIDINAGCSRGLLFGVAIENIADNFLRGERVTKEYKNLKHF
ncbi:MAG: hypothetical protein WCX62_04815 [Synergistaceae bacterium]|jgi:hypothetical protein